MNRILIAVGCDLYDHLQPLHGAERDATRVSTCLLPPEGDYSPDFSIVLRSPSLEELRAALSTLPFSGETVETLTFFFAGHGIMKAGAYYLCARDTDIQSLSTTALALGALLTVVTELRPLQANIIIDACQSGGAMLDSASVLRPDALGLGNPGSLGIAFIAACGPAEYAMETDSGGLLTEQVLRYVHGDEVLQTTRPFLDLIDLGRRVSAELSASLSAQLPVTWGLNLVGEGRFARNPRFASDPEAIPALSRVASLLDSSATSAATREVLRSHAFALWHEHRQAEEEVDVASLRRTLGAVVADLGDEKTVITRVLRGLATSLRASAVKSSDVFGELVVLYACAEPLLAFLDHEDTASVAHQLLSEAAQAQAQARHWLLETLPNDPYALLSGDGGVAELYFLPLRLSRVLGWLAAGVEIDRLCGTPSAVADQELQGIAQLILHQYAPSLIARSDSQAGLVWTFSQVAQSRGWSELAAQVLGCYFLGFVDSNGVIARPSLSGADAFYFLLGLSQGSQHVEHRFRAIPTQFLSTLLLAGGAFSLDNEWDPDLRRLDHHSGYVFIPEDYRDFAADRIEHGRNFAFEIGLDVWTLADFRAYWAAHVSDALEAATRALSPVAASLALVAACLQPDRLPLHLLRFQPASAAESAPQRGSS